MKAFTQNLKHSWQNFKDYRNWTALAALIDLVALIIFFKSAVYIKSLVEVHIAAVDVLVKALPEDPAALAAAGAEMTVHTEAITKYAWMVVALAVLIWALSQGISWFLCSKIAMRKKVDMSYFSEHLLKFFVLTVFWTAVLLLIAFFSLSLAAKGTFSDISSSVMMILVLCIPLTYFEFLSYAIVPKYRLGEIVQKTFRTGIAHFGKAASAYVFAVALIAVLFFLMKMMWQANVIWALVFFAVVMLPAFSYIRILYVKVMS